MDSSNLSESNLSNLSNTEFQQLSELSEDLHLSNEMEMDESEVIIETEEIEEEEEVMHTEIGAHEIEIETEQPHSPEEILPDVKQPKATAPPPLRPLTIAPKPVAMKPMPGQQLLLLQGGAAGQTIKLVSSQGQELNLANVSLGRPVAIKPAIKTLTTQGNISIVQPKQMMMMKKVIAPGKQKPIFANKPGHIVLMQQKSVESPVQQQQVKLIQTQVPLPNPTKTITLQQAQEMGLLTNATKIITTSQQGGNFMPKQAVLLNKTPTTKGVKVVPQVAPAQLIAAKTVAVKSPAKILPATSGNSNSPAKLPQRLYFKSPTTGGAQIPSQIIQVGGAALNAGQVHQINIPGKGVQYFKFVTANSEDSIVSSPKTVATTITPPSIVLSELKAPPSNIAPKPPKLPISKSATISTNFLQQTQQQIVVLPNYISTPSTNQPIVSKVPIPVKHLSVLKSGGELQSGDEGTSPIVDPTLESNGMRPRKPCNCTKSQCLKLYCDCFANGEFCYMCNCMNCFNNLENEDHRQRAIKTCLERNPHAFRPKIGKAKDISGDSSIRKHNKGCNCKRSGCLKNYCECYEAKIACSNNCKCIGCRNIEDSMDKKSLRTSDNVGSETNIRKLTPYRDSVQFRPRRSSSTKQAINFITDDVIEATAQCMLTKSDSGETNMQDEELTKRQIIEEFGQCLTEIINYSAVHN